MRLSHLIRGSLLALALPAFSSSPAPADTVAPVLKELPAALRGSCGVYPLIEARAVSEAFGRDDELARAVAGVDPAALDPDGAYLLRVEQANGAVRAANRARAAAAMAPEGVLGEAAFIGPFGTGEDGDFLKSYPPESGVALSGEWPGKDGLTARWRTLRLAAGDFIFNPGRFLYPSEKAVVYFAADFTLPGGGETLIRLGASDRVILWIDGVERFRFTDRHRFAAGQFRLALDLPAGRHRLLVKQELADASSRFSLSARSSGAPVAFAPPVDGPFASASPRAARLLPPPRPCGYDPDYARGLWLWRLQAFNALEHADLAALDAAERRGGERVRLVNAWAQPQNEHEIEILRRCAERPAEAPSCTLRLARLEWRRDRVGEARRLLDALPPAWRASPDAEILDAGLRGGGPLAAAAAQRAERLAAAHPDRGDLWPQVAELYRGANLPREALRADEAAAAQSPGDPGLARRVAERRLSLDGGESAFAAVVALAEADPLEVGLREDLGNFWLKLERPERALPWFDGQLAISPNDPEGLRGRAEALSRLGREQEANEALRRAAAARPQDEDLARYSAWRERRDEGFETPYRTDPRGLLATQAAASGRGAEILLRHTVVKVAPSGLSSRYRQMIVRIGDETGVKAWERFYEGFDATVREFTWLSARRYRTDGAGGSTVSEAERGVYTPADGADNMYYRSRVASARFPGLRPGDVISLEYRIDDNTTSNAYGEYFGDLEILGDNYPLRALRYTLLMPAGKTVYHEVRGLPDAPRTREVSGSGGSTLTERVWEFRDLEPRPLEPDAPPPVELYPFLHVSTFRTWEQLGAWYAGFIRDRFTLEAPQRAEFLADAGRGEDALIAAHRRTVHRVHYIGLEFGVRGILPFTAAQSLRQGFGDCKDKATLFATLADTLGEPADIVLVRTRDEGRVEAGLASLALFNHAIAHLPRGDRYVDGTADFVGLGELPAMDQGGDALVISRDGRARRVTLPRSTPSDNREEREYAVTPAPAGEDRATIEARVMIRGAAAPSLRARYEKAEIRREQLEKAASGIFPGFKLTDARFSDLADYEAPVEIRYEGSSERLLRRSAGTLWLEPRLGEDRLTPEYAALERRTLPLALGVPFEKIMTIRYALPAGHRLRRLPAPAGASGPFGRWKVEWTAGERSVSVRSEFSLTAARVSQAEYPAFRTFIAAADAAFSATAEVAQEQP